MLRGEGHTGNRKRVQRLMRIAALGHRMPRRVDVEADDVLDLGGEGAVVGPLEGADTVAVAAGALPQFRCSPNRCCQRHTDRRLTPTSEATVRTGTPSADNSTIRARLRVLLLAVAVTDDGSQSRAVLDSDDDPDSLCPVRSFPSPPGV